MLLHPVPQGRRGKYQANILVASKHIVVCPLGIPRSQIHFLPYVLHKDWQFMIAC